MLTMFPYMEIIYFLKPLSLKNNGRQTQLLYLQTQACYLFFFFFLITYICYFYVLHTGCLSLITFKCLIILKFPLAGNVSRIYNRKTEVFSINKNMSRYQSCLMLISVMSPEIESSVSQCVVNQTLYQCQNLFTTQGAGELIETHPYILWQLML